MRNSSWLIISALVLFTSCNSNLAFEESREIEGRVWKTDNVLRFEFTTSDTASLYNLFFNLRHEKTYPFANLHVFTKTTNPDSTSSEKPVEFILADPSGRWLGKSSGDLVNHRILFRRKIRFPQPGTYTIELEQGMRSSDLDGVTDVGLAVEYFE